MLRRRTPRSLRERMNESRFDNYRNRRRIYESSEVDDFIEDIEKTLAEPKYQELKHTTEEFSKRLSLLESRKDSLQKLPTKAEVEKQSPKVQKPSRIEAPEEDEPQNPPKKESKTQQSK